MGRSKNVIIFRHREEGFLFVAGKGVVVKIRNKILMSLLGDFMMIYIYQLKIVICQSETEKPSSGSKPKKSK